MNKILITGGAGFIGSHIVDLYLKNNYEVVVVDNFSSGKRSNISSNDVKIYDVDICDAKVINDIFNTEKPQIVSHHAAQINANKSISEPALDAEINIVGGINILNAAKQNGAKKIIFSSSAAIYGEADIIPTPESTTANPVNPYGVSKYAFESYMKYYHDEYDIDCIILRYSNVYGPRQNNEGEAGVVSLFVNQIISNNQLIINGNGSQTRDFVFVEDVARANLIAAKSDYPYLVANVATGKENSINELYAIIKENFDRQISKKYGPRRKGDQARSALNPNLIKQELNWEPAIDLNTGIQKTIDYFRQN